MCSAPGSAPLQMVLQRSSSYLLTLANFSLGEQGPVRGALGLQGHSLFFTAGTKVSEGTRGCGAGAELRVPTPLCSPSPGVAAECHRPWVPPLLHVSALPAS